MKCKICGSPASFRLMHFHGGVCSQCALSRRLNETGLLEDLPYRQQVEAGVSE